MRVGVYTDYTYHRTPTGEILADRAFAVFLDALSSHFDSLTLLGRIEPGPGGRYLMGEGVRFRELPHYPALTDFARVFGATLGSAKVFWRSLDDVDAVWLLGPHPFSFLFAALARVRGRAVVLGVRQDLPQYTAHRHPESRLRKWAAVVLEKAHRLLARRLPVVAVGPAIGHAYRHAKALSVIAVSLVRSEQIAEPSEVSRDYSGDLTLLSVGRLDAEKNPLLLIEVLAALRETEPRWRLVICGEGDAEPSMRALAKERGVEDSVEFRGYVPIDQGMDRLYRDSHILLHVSWTEGLPQVLLEAMAACLPVIATNVGGIGEALEGSVWLIPPGEVKPPVGAAAAIADDESLRRELIAAGRDRIGSLTLEHETAKVAEFIREGAGR